MDDLWTCIQINMNWARKFSNLVYPQELAESLWNDVPYILRTTINELTTPLGWGTFGKDFVYVRKEEGAQVGLFRSEEVMQATISFLHSQVQF